MAKDIFYDMGDYYLRGIYESDLQGNWFKWFNDEEVTKFENKKIVPNTYERQKVYFDYLLRSDSDIVFAIIEKSTDTHIGNIGIHKIDYIHRRAEIGIVIGEKEHWGKGVGKSAISVVSDHCFNVLNLHRLYAYIMDANAGSVKAFEKNGFEYEGKMKDHYYKNGQYYDAIVVGRLKA